MQDTVDPTTATRAGTGFESPHRLIASNRVEGTPVYNRAGEKLGRIESIMIDKVSGQAEYAVMTFGGLFSLGGRHYPLPWTALTYKPDKGGYVVELMKEQVEKAPSFDPGDEPAFDRDYGRTVYDYYGVVYTY